MQYFTFMWQACQFDYSIQILVVKVHDQITAIFANTTYKNKTTSGVKMVIQSTVQPRERSRH